MKQKILFFIALVIGLAACTKEADADADINNLQMDIPYAEFLTNAYGEYNGVWVVDQQEIDSAKLTVKEAKFIVRYPVEYLFNRAYENAEYKTSWADYGNLYIATGYSQNLVYCDFTISTLPPYTVVDYRNMANVAAIQPFTFQSSQDGIAIFDTKTNLWTLQVAIDRANQYTPDGNSEIIKEIPPINLVYIAQKKIR